MAIIPAEKLIGRNSFFGNIYKDKEGTFSIVERNIQEIIEAVVTRGRGYEEKEGLYVPFSENNSLKEKINPSVFCYRNLQIDKFPGFINDLSKGHPEYSKLYFNIIELPPFVN